MAARRHEKVLPMRRLQHGVDALAAVARRKIDLRAAGNEPSIAFRTRLKSSLVGLKTTKCTPADGWSLILSGSDRCSRRTGCRAC